MAKKTTAAEPQPVKLMLYKWAGKWGPFKVKIPCGECALTEDVIEDVLHNDLKGIPIDFQVKEWLTYWWEPLFKGGWHAPIVMVEGKVISQGDALNRGILTEMLVRAYAESHPIKGNHLFGKESCPHCTRAKGYLADAGVDYQYHDVVRNPAALYEMLARVKPIIGEKTPITVPQIFIDGDYIGGADELSERLDCEVLPNGERGQCSLSPGKLKKAG